MSVSVKDRIAQLSVQLKNCQSEIQECESQIEQLTERMKVLVNQSWSLRGALTGLQEVERGEVVASLPNPPVSKNSDMN